MGRGHISNRAGRPPGIASDLRASSLARTVQSKSTTESKIGVRSFMRTRIHDSIDLLRRISRRWITVLETTAYEIAAHIVKVLAIAVTERWSRRTKGKRSRKSRRKRLAWALGAIPAVLGFAIATTTLNTLLHDRYALQVDLSKLQSNAKVLSEKFEVLDKQLRNSDRLEGVATRPKPDRRPTASESSNPKRIIEKARRAADALLTYESDIELNRPPLILAVSASAITERTIAAGEQFEKNTLLDFCRRFSGLLYELEQEFREQGVDTSRLHTHLAQLMNTQMIRLMAFDLNAMADQLENRRYGRNVAFARSQKPGRRLAKSESTVVPAQP